MHLDLSKHGHATVNLDHDVDEHIHRAIRGEEVGLDVTAALSHVKALADTIPHELELRPRAAHNHGAQRVAELAGVGPRRALAGGVAHFLLFAHKKCEKSA